jgi:hypothetical protein
VLTLRRFLLVALLLGLVIGCGSKSSPRPAGDRSLENKKKTQEEPPEGPRLRR